MLASSHHLRQHLANILYLFRRNAEGLFHRDVKLDGEEAYLLWRTLAAEQTDQQNLLRLARPQLALDAKKLTPEALPYQIFELSLALNKLLTCFDEFPELTDQAMKASVTSFEADLKVCLITLLHMVLNHTTDPI